MVCPVPSLAGIGHEILGQLAILGGLGHTRPARRSRRARLRPGGLSLVERLFAARRTAELADRHSSVVETLQEAPVVTSSGVLTWTAPFDLKSA